MDGDPVRRVLSCGVTFSRFHVGERSVHRGARRHFAALFDHMFGMISHAGRPISRLPFCTLITVTPIDVPLIVRGRVTNTEVGVCVRGTV